MIPLKGRQHTDIDEKIKILACAGDRDREVVQTSNGDDEQPLQMDTTKKKEEDYCGTHVNKMSTSPDKVPVICAIDIDHKQVIKVIILPLPSFYFEVL